MDIAAFEKFFNKVPGEILWAHAVNSKARLQQVVQNSTDFVESDINFTQENKLVIAHPPHTTSDLRLNDLVTSIKNSKLGLKLDFKHPEAVTQSLNAIQGLTNPVVLHADILQGVGARIPLFDAETFVTECQRYYPSGLISLGWTTTPNPKQLYSIESIKKMTKISEGLDLVTICVRANKLQQSWKLLLPLLEKENVILTIWTNDPYSEATTTWIKANTDPKKTFYDLSDNNNQKT